MFDPRKRKYTITLMILRRTPSFQEAAMVVVKLKVCHCACHTPRFIYTDNLWLWHNDVLCSVSCAISHPALLLTFFSIVSHVLIHGITVCTFITISTYPLTLFLFPGCHSPPVSDSELIAIIKIFNAEKHNPAAKLTWQCGACIKAKNTINQQSRQFIAVRKTAPRRPQETIVIDDDDEVIALDEPKRNNIQINQLSHAKRSSTTQNVLSHPKHPTSITKDNKIQIIDDPFLVPDPSPPSKTSQTSTINEDRAMIDLTTSGDEGSIDSDNPLEYLTPPPRPISSSKQATEVVDKVPTILTPNQFPPHPSSQVAPQTSVMTTAAPQLLNQLLPRWLNDRSIIGGVKPDLWARTRLRQDQDTANRRGLREPSHQAALLRKCKAHKLSEGSLTYSRATIFLSAEGWLREKKANLLLE